MTFRARITLVVVWAASLVLVGVLVQAQSPLVQLVPLPTPVVISGSELGFRVEGRRGSTPVGRLVVRTSPNGPWMEPEFDGPSPKRLAAR